MENKNTIITLFSIIAIALFFLGMLISSGTSTEIKYVNQTVITEKLVNQTCPVINDYKTDKIFESEFATEISEIEDVALLDAEAEFEEDDYEVIEDYFISEFEDYREGSIKVNVDESEVSVVLLGLDEDEDKSAKVEFDIYVKYKTEEGSTAYIRKKLTAVYLVTYDEGDFDDEKVKLILLE